MGCFQLRGCSVVQDEQRRQKCAFDELLLYTSVTIAKQQSLVKSTRGLKVFEILWDPIRVRVVWAMALGPPAAALQTTEKLTIYLRG